LALGEWRLLILAIEDGRLRMANEVFRAEATTRHNRQSQIANHNRQSQIANLNRQSQSTISIANRQSQSSIANRKIGNRHSAIASR
jgi:hypothetical protein